MTSPAVDDVSRHAGRTRRPPQSLSACSPSRRWRWRSRCPCSTATIVNVALPTIARDLAIPPASSIWIVNAFLLAVTVSLLPLSALGDTIGYRRVYHSRPRALHLASLACALAPSLAALAPPARCRAWARPES